MEERAPRTLAPPTNAPTRTVEELLYELQLREIELELQNEELRRAHVALANSCDRYRDLFELAPIGYLTLTGSGLISEMNLTCARMLGADRKKMLNRCFASFVAPEDADRYHRLISNVMLGVGRQADELAVQRADGSVLEAQLDCLRVGVEGKPSTIRITLIDISARKQAESDIERLAFYDSLTRLPNRRLLLDRVRHALAARSRHSRYGALLFIDLDDFKALNDTHGHDMGDRLLRQVAQRLLTCVRVADTAARLGGDEFVVMLDDLSEDALEAASQARVVAEKILLTLAPPHVLGDLEFRSTASIGVTLFIDHQETVDDLLKRADLAMYRAKSDGRHLLTFYEPSMQAPPRPRSR